MPRITLPDFVDVVSKSGVRKMKKVAELKNVKNTHPCEISTRKCVNKPSRFTAGTCRKKCWPR